MVILVAFVKVHKALQGQKVILAFVVEKVWLEMLENEEILVWMDKLVYQVNRVLLVEKYVTLNLELDFKNYF